MNTKKVEEFKNKIIEHRKIETELNDFRAELKTLLSHEVTKNNIELAGNSFKSSSASGSNYISLDVDEGITLTQLNALESALSPKEVIIKSKATTKSVMNNNYGKPFLKVILRY